MTAPAAPAVVNAYLSGAEVVLLRRDGGVVKRSAVRADFAVYLERADVSPDLERALRTASSIRSIRSEGSWLRVGLSDGESRGKLTNDKFGYFAKAGVRTYEGDVDPVLRHLVDHGVTIQAPRRAYLDIETDSRQTFAGAKKGDARVLSWAVGDDEGNAASGLLDADDDEDERRLLRALWKHLEAYDQVVAWNGDGFDFPVIVARSDLLDVKFDPRRWLWLDHLLLFKRMNMHSAESGDEKQSMRLGSIAQSVLGDGKDDFDSSKTWEAWEAGGEERARLLRYNEKDTDLLRRIEAKTGYASLFDTVCEACGVLPETRSLQPTIQMDGFMLRLGLQRGYHFPTRRFREVTGQFAGAYVMAPATRGIEREVHVADFKSLYPSVILTWNMSPETKRGPVPEGLPIQAGTCRSPLTGETFDVNADGILTGALRTLLSLRDHWKKKKKSLPAGSAEWHDADRRSTAYKVVANSFYGILGAVNSRFYDVTIAESVTQNAKWLILKTIQEAEKNPGWRCIYADTDSLFVTGCTRTAFEEFVRKCNGELYPALLKTVGCVKNEIVLDYEKAFDRIVFSGKKRYAGWYSHYAGQPPKPMPAEGEGFDPDAHSHPEVKGLEYKRGDTALLARRLQEQIIMMIMRGEERTERISAVLDRWLARVLNDPLAPEEVVLSKSLSKSLKEYKAAGTMKNDGTAKALPPHVQVAHMLRDRGKEIGEGARVSYFVVDGSRAPQRVLPAEDLGTVDPDRYYLWEDLIYRPTQRLLEAAFPDHNWENSYTKIRPATPRRGAQVAKEQTSLDLPPMESRLSMAAEPRVDLFAHEAYGEDFLHELHALLKRYPGKRPVTIHLRLATGAVTTLDPRAVRVCGGEGMMEAVERLRFGYAAWIAACHAAS